MFLTEQMPRSYFYFLARRFIWCILIITGICCMPGPRSLINKASEYVLTAESQASLRAGFHLSATPYCWLFGWEIQTLPYPESVDSLLAAIAFLISTLFQCALAALLYLVYRNRFIWYDDDHDEEDEEDEAQSAA